MYAVAEGEVRVRKLWSTHRFATPIVTLVVTAVVFVSGGSASAAPSGNIASGEVWADTAGSPIRAGGAGIFRVGSTYYWVGEDHEGQSGAPDGQYWTFRRLRCYSSADLSIWTRESDALALQGNGDLGLNRIVERPKVLYNTASRQYVMYMHLDSTDYQDARVGVATSPIPCGPYTYRGGFRPLGNDSRDISLFKDTDGIGYLVSSTSGNKDLVIYRLAADYLSTEREVTRFTDGSREAPAMTRVNGTYFLITSGTSYWDPNMQKYNREVTGGSMV
jgi:hypothetical protein